MQIAENAALSLATAEVFLEGPIPEEVVEGAFDEQQRPPNALPVD